MNRKIRTTLYCASLLLSMAACREEALLPVPNGEGNIRLADGRICYALYSNPSHFERPVTRTGIADEENVTGDMWVFVFDASTTDTLFLEAVRTSDHQATNSGLSKRTAILKTRTDKVTLLVLDNTPTHYFDGANNIAITDVDSWGITPSTKLADARKRLNTVRLSLSPQPTVPYTPNLPMPLSAEVNLDKLDISTELGSVVAPLRLQRVAARLVVKKEFPIIAGYTHPNFILKGATVYNTPRNASLFPVHKSNSTATDRTNYIGADVGNEIVGIAEASAYGSDPAGITTEANPIYLYPSAESLDANRPFVLIQAQYATDATDTYYKLALNTPDKRINRNTAYRLLIEGCTGRGYATITQALVAPPSNLITYNMEVTDLTSHDILDNGQYYLAFSNSEYMFYITGAATNLTVTTLSYKQTAGVTSDITITDVAGASPTITRNPFTAAGSTATSEDLNMTFPATFKSCTLVVRYGNLTQRIPITHRYTMPSAAIVQKQFASPDADYVYGNIEFPAGTPHWVGLSTDSLPKNGGLDALSRNDKGKFYLKLISNHEEVRAPGDTIWAVNRYASLYLSRPIEKGRVKIYMQQDALNMARINNISDPGFVPFVGAFWRSNQTGERLIQITNSNITGSISLDGYWYTSNIYYDENWDPDNGDGVRVDNLPSLDTQVWKAGGPTKSGNDTGFDTDYPVSKNQFAEGEMSSDPNGRIYFRIGLDRPYTPTAAAPARYAIVVLSYTSNSSVKYQRMFIRQGEDADYLMRPFDQYGNKQTWATAPTWRPNAVKFQPYNLTDPYGFPTMIYANMTTMPLRGDASDNRKLTAYPTQAGAMFLYAAEYTDNSITYIRKAIPPTYTGVATGAISSLVSPVWDPATRETCPAEYRRPADATQAAVTANYPSNIRYFADKTPQDSEIRQSLWISPGTGNGGQATNNANRIEGYYADGYFDRRPIESSISSIGNTPRSAVNANSNDVAYKGALLFNPNSYASLFFPWPGKRALSGAAIQYAGDSGCYWSSTITNGDGNNLATGAMNLGAYGNEAFGYTLGNISPLTSTGKRGTTIISWSNSRGGSIRCVKDE